MLPPSLDIYHFSSSKLLLYIQTFERFSLNNLWRITKHQERDIGAGAEVVAGLRQSPDGGSKSSLETSCATEIAQEEAWISELVESAGWEMVHF